jgi:RHS repeat-associated protein
VTVQHNGGAIQTATQYSDKTYVRDGISLTSGNNTFAVTGVSTGGPQHSVSLTLNLPASVSFVHDDNGNMTGDGGRAFEYDDENQLKAAQVAGVWRAEFVYDGFERLRVRREFTWSGSAWALAGETRYLYDGMRVIQERSGNNTPLVSYTRGLDLSGTMQRAGGIGGLLARSHGYSGGNWTAHSYYHSDGNGNVTALMRASTAVTNQLMVAKYLYDPYGNTLGQWGPLADANVYRFSSKEFHANSGLYYYGFRFYDPNLQRWINRDPIGEVGGINLYGFLLLDQRQSLHILAKVPDIVEDCLTASRIKASHPKSHPTRVANPFADNVGRILYCPPALGLAFLAGLSAGAYYLLGSRPKSTPQRLVESGQKLWRGSRAVPQEVWLRYGDESRVAPRAEPLEGYSKRTDARQNDR